MEIPNPSIPRWDKPSTQTSRLRLLILLGASWFLAACGMGGEKVAGTSSGVDNPQLTLGFKDSLGMAARFSGTVSVFEQSQNPALNALPLAQFRLDQASFLNLGAADFERNADSASAAKWTDPFMAHTLAKQTGADDSLFRFNVLFKTLDQKGSLAGNLIFNRKSRRFEQENQIAMQRVDLTVKPLRRISAKVDRQDKAAGTTVAAPDRVFIPGTPFVAILTDSGFVFDDLPEGDHPVLIYTGAGQLIPVSEKLNPQRAPALSTPKDDTAVTNTVKPDTTNPLRISAGEDRIAFLGREETLGAEIENGEKHSLSDLHGLWLWRELSNPGTGALLLQPRSEKTPVKFPKVGVYRFEVTFSRGAQSARDTVTISVQNLPAFLPEIQSPRPGEILFASQGILLTWLDSAERKVRFEFSVDSGKSWQKIEMDRESRPGINQMKWIPPAEWATVQTLLLRLVSILDDQEIARMTKPFFIKARPESKPPR